MKKDRKTRARRAAVDQIMRAGRCVLVVVGFVTASLFFALRAETQGKLRRRWNRQRSQRWGKLKLKIINAMTIDEMYRLRKKTKGSRRGWGQHRPGKNVLNKGLNTHFGSANLRLRVYVNLFSLLFILTVVVATIRQL